MNINATTSDLGYPSFEGRPARRKTLFLNACLRQRLGVIGAVLILLLLIGAVVGPLVAPYASDELVGDRLLGPGEEGFVLGTDQTGRDEFSRLLNGFRQTAIVAFAATAVSTFAALAIGLPSGWTAGRWPDVIIQRFVDAGMSFPTLIMLITVVTIVGGGLVQLVFTLGLLASITGSRVVRAAVMTVKDLDYISATRSTGASEIRLVFRHVLPNVLAPLIVMSTLNLGAIVLAEASLSFLGLGITDPALPTWGRMLFESRRVFHSEPLLAVWPGLMISLTVFGFNMFGDALRDLLDPRLRS